MAARKEVSHVNEIPNVIVDPGTRKKYIKGRFLGKGGFARCYELTEEKTGMVFAGKTVAKSMLTKTHQKEKLSQEIAIHRSLSHKHIVGFYGFFEDENNVYIILELCRKRSLMEMLKRRKMLTEHETRYFMKQIVIACKYLHGCRVIHRDLKLGNLFLNDEMEIKVGDFGLATRVDYEGERKKTLCGTPNYIAPEVLNKKGHSYEVDAWSLGCIMFTLLIGKPPFETNTLKDTYSKIKKNEYHIPSKIGISARNLIQKLLRSEPSLRPSMAELLRDDFLTGGYLPSRLPTSCLTVAPRFDKKNMSMMAENSQLSSRKPLAEVNIPKPELVPKMVLPEKLTTVPEAAVLNLEKNEEKEYKASEDVPADYYLSDLCGLLSSLLEHKPGELPIIQQDEAEDPAAIPFIWLSKWVDYTDKYGLGYQLCDNSVGVLFNDSTRLILIADGHDLQYIKADGEESYHTLERFPDGLKKKVTLLKYFRTYMNEHLLKAGGSVPREGDELTRVPYLRSWFRTKEAIIFHLTNGTLQLNFFEDHTKIILCPLMGAVSFIDVNKEFRTYKLNLIEQYGCSKMLAARLAYALKMVKRLMSTKTASRKCV